MFRLLHGRAHQRYHGAPAKWQLLEMQIWRVANRMMSKNWQLWHRNILVDVQLHFQKSLSIRVHGKRLFDLESIQNNVPYRYSKYSSNDISRLHTDPGSSVKFIAIKNNWTRK